ncbi:MAG: hypothetical protein ACRC0V_08590, partial [Fusobacteriaceae bacterium]
SDLGLELNFASVFRTFERRKNIITTTFSLSEFPDIDIKDTVVFNFGRANIYASLKGGYESSPLFFRDNNGNEFATIKNADMYLHGSIDMGVGDYSMLSFQSRFKNLEMTYYRGDPTLSDTEMKPRYFRNSAIFRFDNLDSFISPTSGLLAQLEGVLAKNNKNINFYAGVGQINLYFPITKSLTLSILTTGGYLPENKNVPIEEIYKIGGLQTDLQHRNFAFYGLQLMDKYSLESYVGAVEMKYNIWNFLWLKGRYNYAYTKDLIDFSSGSPDFVAYKKFAGYGGGLEAQTFFGPIEIIVTNNSQGSGAIFQLFAGYSF